MKVKKECPPPPPPYGIYGNNNALGNALVKRAGGMSISKSLSGEWNTVDPEWIIVREYYVYSSTEPVFGYDAVEGPWAADMMDNIRACLLLNLQQP